MALQRPAKLKHFLWRACKGFLAVKERLFYRHIVSEKSCSICSSLDETIIHSTFECAAAKEIWAASSFMAQINVAPAGSFVERFMWLSKNELVTTAALAWASWHCRNKHIFEQDGFNAVEVAKSWVNLVNESNAYAIKVINRTAPTVGPSPSSWSCPSAGTVKVNCDAYLGAKTGLGVVIRSEHGHLLGVAVREEYRGWNVEAVEAAACRFGLIIAWRLGYTKVQIESDAATVVQTVKIKAVGFSPVFLLYEIQTHYNL